MRIYSRVMATAKRPNSYPGFMFSPIVVGEHESCGRKPWESDAGRYLQVDLGINHRRYFIQFNEAEARELLASLKAFLHDKP